jgi:hypothetical protein
MKEAFGMRVFAVRLSAFGAGLMGGLLASLLLLHVAFAAGERVATVALTANSMRIAGPPPLSLRLSVPVSGPQYDVYLPVVLSDQ